MTLASMPSEVPTLATARNMPPWKSVNSEFIFDESSLGAFARTKPTQ